MSKLSKLTKAEQELLRSVEAGEWQSVAKAEKELTDYRTTARATFQKDRRINIRISSRDLDALQKRALMEGIPYQTLITSVLHKFVAGRYQDPPTEATLRSALKD